MIRFTDYKSEYSGLIEAENLKKQPDEILKSYMNRLNTSVNCGWPTTTSKDNQRTVKKMEFLSKA